MQNNEELVSVIVPFYNAGQFLEPCLHSIVSQTWSNMEIILINDGSTDNSEEICEKYGRKDSRISIVHKENGGPAEARNVGINRARGKYIAFIDSDDFVHRDFIKTLYLLMQRYESDIAICNYYSIKGTKPLHLKEKKKENTEALVVSKKEMLENWHGKYKHLETMPWNKLYKRELFINQNIKFPEGVFAEDVQTLHLVVAASDKVVITGQKLYYYNQREGSLTHSLSEEKIEGCILSQKIRLQYFETHGYKKAYERMNIKKQKYYMLAYCITKTDSLKRRLIEEFMNCYEGVRKSSEIRKSEKMLFGIFRRCYKLIGRICYGFN